MRFRRVNKMSEKSADEREIRKYRKKLRQIEILEAADRQLSDEEICKVCKKAEIRSHLLELLSNSSAAAEDVLTSESDLSLVPDNDDSEQTVEQSPTDVTAEPMKRSLDFGEIVSCSTEEVGSSKDDAVEAKRVHTCPPDTDGENALETENPPSEPSQLLEEHLSDMSEKFQSESLEIKEKFQPESLEIKEKLQSESSEIKEKLQSKSSEIKEKIQLEASLKSQDVPTKTSKMSENLQSEPPQESVLLSESSANAKSKSSHKSEEHQSKAKKKQTKSAKSSLKTEKSEPSTRSRRRPERRHFMAWTLRGHNDVVCSVAVNDRLILTGSRDTTLKLWDGGLGVEVCSMGGHTDTVSAVLLLTSVEAHTIGRCLDQVVERVGVSGSRDCTLRYWNLDTGSCLHSCYTYNTITALGFLFSSQQANIVVGSEGGKLELWDVLANCVHTSLAVNQEPITAVKVVGSMIYTASACGLLSVYQLGAHDSLHVLFQSENLKLASGVTVQPRPIRCLAPHGDLIYYGDEGMNLKVLNWKLGLVHKLSHHSGEFGFTDSVCCVGDKLLLASGYDLDNGVGYINGWSLSGEKYTFTLCDENTGRIMCMDTDLSSLGHLTIVTGGSDLKLWTEAGHQADSDSLVATQYVPQFDRVARNSDVDSEVSDNESEDPPLPWQRDDDEDDQKGWMSWCTLL